MGLLANAIRCYKASGSLPKWKLCKQAIICVKPTGAVHSKCWKASNLTEPSTFSFEDFLTLNSEILNSIEVNRHRQSCCTNSKSFNRESCSSKCRPTFNLVRSFPTDFITKREREKLKLEALPAFSFGWSKFNSISLYSSIPYSILIHLEYNSSLQERWIDNLAFTWIKRGLTNEVSSDRGYT